MPSVVPGFQWVAQEPWLWAFLFQTQPVAQDSVFRKPVFGFMCQEVVSTWVSEHCPVRGSQEAGNWESGASAMDDIRQHSHTVV